MATISTLDTDARGLGRILLGDGRCPRWCQKRRGHWRPHLDALRSPNSHEAGLPQLQREREAKADGQAGTRSLGRRHARQFTNELRATKSSGQNLLSDPSVCAPSAHWGPTA